MQSAFELKRERFDGLKSYSETPLGWPLDRFTPLEIEIGSGTGKYLCRMARKNIDKKYIGIDINNELCINAQERIDNLGLSNVSIINAEARRFVTENVRSACIAAVHVYFPTPIPQTIGLTQRLICRDFLDQIYRILVPGGSIRVATDDVDYFEITYASFRFLPWWLVDWSPPIPVRTKGLLVDTPGEKQYGGAGRQVYVLQALK